MLTKLEAVNLMLDAIGEAPVNSLASGNPDAASAERRLDRVKKDVLAKGWHANTRDGVELTADAGGYVAVPGNTMKVDTTGISRRWDVVLDASDSRLINRTLNTKVFPVGTKLRVEMILDLDWTVLPYSLRRYIAARATREWQAGEMAATDLDRFASRDEQMAFDDAVSDDLASRDLNVLRDNPSWGRPRVRRRS